MKSARPIGQHARLAGIDRQRLAQRRHPFLVLADGHQRRAELAPGARRPRLQVDGAAQRRDAPGGAARASTGNPPSRNRRRRARCAPARTTDRAPPRARTASPRDRASRRSRRGGSAVRAKTLRRRRRPPSPGRRRGRRGRRAQRRRQLAHQAILQLEDRAQAAVDSSSYRTRCPPPRRSATP